jgi:hypothetical protein
MFDLITTFYLEKDLNRRSELLQALSHNIENPYIQHIYILCESGDENISDFGPKVKIVKQGQRPRFQDLIKFANGLSKSKLKIIANTDIYFDETLNKAHDIKNKHVYCLTRWDLKKSGFIEFYPNFQSQDSWIFRNTLPDNIGGFYLGIPGCDNRLAAEFIESGFKIMNPSLSIRTIHLHETQKRNYIKDKDRIVGTYAYSLPVYFKNDYISRDVYYLYFLVRRKFYTAIIKKRISRKNISSIDRKLALFFLIYYRLKVKFITTQ